MGGSISLWLSQTCNNLVKKMILLAPATNKKLMKLNLNWIPFASRSSFLINEKIISFAQSIVVYNQDLITKENLKNYYKPYKNNPDAIKTFIKATEIIRDQRMPKCFKDNSTPIKVIWGKHDRLVKKKYMKELIKYLECSELITDESSGHHIMEDHPELIYKTSLDFFI